MGLLSWLRGKKEEKAERPNTEDLEEARSMHEEAMKTIRTRKQLLEETRNQILLIQKEAQSILDGNEEVEDAT